LVVPQLAVGGHVEVALVADGRQQSAAVGLPGDDDRPAIPAAQQGRARIEPEAGFLLFRTVAALALLHEQRPDFLLEERGRIGGLTGGACTGQDQHEGESEDRAEVRSAERLCEQTAETCTHGGSQPWVYRPTI